MKRVNYKVSIQRKYIHLIKTSCTPLSDHSLISHTTHPCHNLYSSLTFIMVFCHLPFYSCCQSVFQCLPWCAPISTTENREVFLAVKCMMKNAQWRLDVVDRSQLFNNNPHPHVFCFSDFINRKL